MSTGPAGVAASAYPTDIFFLSPMCILDVVNGAALDMLEMLETLAAAGHRVGSYSASLFDANGEVDFAPFLGLETKMDRSSGEVLTIERHNVTHHVCLTASSQGKRLRDDERNAITDAWNSVLDRFAPRVVLTFGTSPIAQRMQQKAREAGAQLVFFFANASIDTQKVLHPGDRSITPSEFLASRYHHEPFDRPDVLHSIVSESRVVPEEDQLLAQHAGLQKKGLVTFVNPLPHKGVTLFVRLAERAAIERPDMQFAVLEGRTPPKILRRLGIDIRNFQNIWWLPAQRNMRAVYAHTGILLAPSVVSEGFGRCVIEAQQSGIPVLASNRGGLGEALGDVEFALPVSEQCVRNHSSYPDEETVELWWAALTALWDDNEHYREACIQAKKLGDVYAPQKTRNAAINYFERLSASLASSD